MLASEFVNTMVFGMLKGTEHGCTQMSNMFLTLCKVRSSELWQCVTDAHTENLQGVREMGILVTFCYFNNF